MIEPAPERRPGVWITRAEPGADATAEQVTRLGLTPIVAPLLSFRPIDADLRLQADEALAFTSIAGVTRAAALSSARGMRVFAVGDATAAAAREAGFSDVTSANGDVAALSILINRSSPRGGVVHPCASETAGDLAAALSAAGLKARKVVVYETKAATTLPPTVRAALQGHRLGALLIHSPKAARAAAGMLAGRGGLASVTALGLSPACIEPLKGCGFQDLAAADASSEDALLRRLTAWASSS